MYTTLSGASSDLTIIANNMESIVSFAGDSVAINSLYTDKAKLDSLFADKITLDSLYADKAVLDSLYADKSKLDSIFADKSKLDSIFNDKTTLDSIYADKATLDSIFADKETIDAIYANLANINTVAGDTLAINDITSEPLRQAVLDAGANATAADARATDSQLEAWISEAHRMTADSISDEPEDVLVKVYTSNGDGTFSYSNSTGYSAFHWYRKAGLAANGSAVNISYDDVTNDIGGSNVQEVVDRIIPKIGEITKDIIGFVDRDTSSISFNDNTRTFTLTLNSETPVYQNGTLVKLTGSYDLVIGNTDGGRYIKYDKNLDSLVEIGDIPSFTEDLLVGYVYWNSTSQKAIIVGDERHGAEVDTQWHSTQHVDIGAVWRTGGSASYTLDNDAEVTLGFATPLVLADEDLVHVVTNSTTGSNPYEQELDIANLEVLYVDSNGSYTSTTGSIMPYLHGTTYASYNSISGTSGSIIEASNNSYIAYWVLGTNDSRKPIKLLVGKNEYSTLAEAEVEMFEDYDLPMPEIVPMYKIVVKTNDTYLGNPASIVIASVNLIKERQSSLVQTFTASNHNSLTGRSLSDQHTIGSITGLQSFIDSVGTIAEFEAALN
jgi:hypothetical protein